MLANACLQCTLDNCDEKNAACLCITPQKKASRKYYLKIRNNPEYQRKKREQKKKYIQTQQGKINWNAQCVRYRKRNPDKFKEIAQKYHERHKQKRLLEHKEYMRKRRE